MKTKNVISVIIFIVSFFLFIAATSLEKNSVSLNPDECFNCGSVTACDSGDTYGWTHCDYDGSATPPYNCTVHGAMCD